MAPYASLQLSSRTPMNPGFCTDPVRRSFCLSRLRAASTAQATPLDNDRRAPTRQQTPGPSRRQPLHWKVQAFGCLHPNAAVAKSGKQRPKIGRDNSFHIVDELNVIFVALTKLRARH